jgi:hypothetical protein
MWGRFVLKNCYAPAYEFCFAPNHAKERSSDDVFFRNLSASTGHPGTKPPGISFAVATRNGSVRRDVPKKTGNFDRRTNDFAENSGGSRTSLIRQASSYSSSNRKAKSCVKGRSRCRAICLCRIIPTARK